MPGYMPGHSPIPTGPQQPSVMGRLASATGQHFYNQLQALLSAAQLPGDVFSGQQNTQAFDPNTGAVGPDPTMLDRASTLASMPMSGGLGGAELGGGLLGSGPMRKITSNREGPPALPFKYEGAGEKPFGLYRLTFIDEWGTPATIHSSNLRSAQRTARSIANHSSKTGDKSKGPVTIHEMVPNENGERGTDMSGRTWTVEKE